VPCWPGSAVWEPGDRRSRPYGDAIETAGTFDLDAELRLEFRGNADIRQLGQMTATYVL
jgi:hypothetical protein